jgi:hypothetical protein
MLFKKIPFTDAVLFVRFPEAPIIDAYLLLEKSPAEIFRTVASLTPAKGVTFAGCASVKQLAFWHTGTRHSFVLMLPGGGSRSPPVA